MSKMKIMIALIIVSFAGVLFWNIKHQNEFFYAGTIEATEVGALAGTATVLGEPSRHVLPVSPEALKTVMPDAAAVCMIDSRLTTSASVVWLSHMHPYVQTRARKPASP